MHHVYNFIMALHPHAESVAAVRFAAECPRRSYRSRDGDSLSDLDDESLLHPELTPGKTVKCWFFFVMTLAILIFMSTSLTAVPTQILFGTFITVFLMMLACIPLAIFDCKRARLSNAHRNYGNSQVVSDRNNLLIRCELGDSQSCTTMESRRHSNWQPTLVIIPAGLAQNARTNVISTTQFSTAQVIPNPTDDPPPYNLVDFNCPLPEVHNSGRECGETPPPPYDNIRSS